MGIMLKLKEHAQPWSLIGLDVYGSSNLRMDAFLEFTIDECLLQMQGSGLYMNKIIIFESKTDSLKTFARQMAEGFKEIGYQVLLADMGNEKQAMELIYTFADPGKTAALFFNHAGLNFLTEERQSVWNELDVDCYDFIVDHPMYYHAAIIFPICLLYTSPSPRD